MDASAKPPGESAAITAYIVVLGAPNAPDGTLSSMARARADQAISEWRSSPGAAVILTGGWGAHFNTAPLPHTHYLAQYLTTHGMPAEAIAAQLSSANTVEDAALVRDLLAQDNTTPLHIITSEHHRARAQIIFEHFFPPRMFHIMATPSLVTDTELTVLLEHEQARISEIHHQGGVIWKGRLLSRLI